MQRIETYQRPAFLNDHPPVLAHMLLVGGEEETTFPGGTVLGRNAEGKLEAWTKESASVAGILAGDVTVPASGEALADVYIHASVVMEELIFADGVSAEDKKTAIAALRAVGVYA